MCVTSVIKYIYILPYGVSCCSPQSNNREKYQIKIHFVWHVLIDKILCFYSCTFRTYLCTMNSCQKSISKKNLQILFELKKKTSHWKREIIIKNQIRPNHIHIGEFIQRLTSWNSIRIGSNTHYGRWENACIYPIHQICIFTVLIPNFKKKITYSLMKLNWSI